MKTFVTKSKTWNNNVAEVSDIILRENQSHRLIFRPLLIDNQKDNNACVKGTFIYQRKGSNNDWEDYIDPELYASKLKSGEGLKLEIKSEEILTLLDNLGLLKDLYGKHGISSGENTFIWADKNIVKILEAVSKIENEQMLQALAQLDPTQVSIFLQNLNLTKLEKLVREWDSNLESHKNNEKFWHKLLKDNPWVLSQIFACPYLLIGDEYYYGGKKGNNKGGVYGDF
ncbi:hypothetical protein GF357_00005, partial [Candidatus Dojkabacteria bacterium]|nr:hypothetical protein [Candidatus Dojkabacteria bacterium]